MTVSELIESLKGIPPETQIRVVYCDNWDSYRIEGVYHEEGTPVDLEIGRWRCEELS